MTFLVGFVGIELCVGGTASPPMLAIPPFADNAVPPAVPGKNGDLLGIGLRAGDGLGAVGTVSTVGGFFGLRPRIWGKGGGAMEFLDDEDDVLPLDIRLVDELRLTFPEDLAR